MAGDFLKVYFFDLTKPLYYPVSMDRHSLAQVIVETFNKRNWHYYEIAQTKVQPADVVVDCGSAEGLFSLTVHERCHKIFLIEPLERFISSLKLTFKNAANIEIIPMAISDREYTARIRSSDISSSLTDGDEGELINVTTIDKLFLPRNVAINYLKLDLEGHDFKALIGAREIIAKYRPKIAVTTYHDKDHANQIKSFLLSVIPDYHILCKGIYQETGSPVMLHAW